MSETLHVGTLSQNTSLQNCEEVIICCLSHAVPGVWLRPFKLRHPWDLQEMETHSSFLAWKIPWAEEPGELQSMGPQRVSHN